ncbi:transporter substrate-binding domain-containing protein [Thalassotalea profundi]|uniref:Solute-binding protein family 3/N-terminal domain-containing protein n=1 Tax=Thalassotalea profundi TaxID=2036687 RepID=A0ABQ3IIE9_9GAMM|nr:transporter substrate-binding domain-containing protein [Thalassotalea profundi]GHE83616.1 hypothetical protein GCM10011501_10240 [Thalassotalea profundi]
MQYQLNTNTLKPNAFISPEVMSKLSYLLNVIVLLVLLVNTVNAHAIEESQLYSPVNKVNNKLIFGTTNSSDTQLFKQANAILTYAFSQLNYEFSLVNLPNKRNLLWANDEKLDGIAFRVDKLEDFYPNIVKVEEALFTTEQWVYSRKNIEVDGWQSLYPYILAYEQGSLFIEQNKDYFLNVIAVTSTENAFALVDKQRADFTITSQSTGDLLLERNKDYAGKIKRQSPALIEISMFSYMHQKHQGLAVELAQELKKMKANGKYDALMHQVR